MSCVLRIVAPDLERALSHVAIAPYRFESATAHFDVSDAGFDQLLAQADDALAYLRANRGDIRILMSQPGARGELDFATERQVAEFQSQRLPAELVRTAGELGLELTISSYPLTRDSGA